MRYKIYPYKMASVSARMLARELGALRLYPNRRYEQKPNHIVINWGNSRPPAWAHLPYPMLNDYAAVHKASNKLLFFRDMAELGITPEYTTLQIEAQDWLDIGIDIIARDALSGCGGHDASFYERGSYIPEDNNHVLYTKYIPKKQEFRVHVFDGKVIQIQEKKCRRDLDREVRDYRIRNHSRGWVFCQENVEAPARVYDYAVKTVEHLGLVFGAVDVVYNHYHDRVVVLECNTAPGLSGASTLNAYVRAFDEYINTYSAHL